mmetsp:Transcript_29805/g.56185  ORF Transcript_29805/g.56185 Transcript_29805/m.56185 type:complete len:338 (-) Transcript_29805:237-1250(-)
MHAAEDRWDLEVFDVGGVQVVVLEGVGFHLRVVDVLRGSVAGGLDNHFAVHTKQTGREAHGRSVPGVRALDDAVDEPHLASRHDSDVSEVAGGEGVEIARRPERRPQVQQAASRAQSLKLQHSTVAHQHHRRSGSCINHAIHVHGDGHLHVCRVRFHSDAPGDNCGEAVKVLPAQRHRLHDFNDLNVRLTQRPHQLPCGGYEYSIWVLAFVRFLLWHNTNRGLAKNAKLVLVTKRQVHALVDGARLPFARRHVVGARGRALGHALHIVGDELVVKLRVVAVFEHPQLIRWKTAALRVSRHVFPSKVADHRCVRKGTLFPGRRPRTRCTRNESQAWAN